MTERPVRCMVVEGKDDAAALRGMIRDLGAQKIDEHGNPMKGEFRAELEHVSFVLLVAQSGKSSLAQRTLDAADLGAKARPVRIGLNFDPDTDPPSKELKFFKESFRDVSKLGTSELVSTEDGVSFRRRNREIFVHAAPWRSADLAGFDGLPDEWNLERVLISGILKAGLDPAWTGWATRTTGDLTTLVKDHGWKRAFRIWNALLRPEAESFVDGLLQDKATKAACLNALKATPVYDVLSKLTAP